MAGLAFNFAVNQVSFGQVSTALLREAYRRNLSLSIFPIGGNFDLSAQPQDQGFESWCRTAIKRGLESHSRKDPSVKLWHISGLGESVADKRIAITFLETDTITSTERNILSNQDIVLVTSKFTKRIMEDFGLKNVRHLELGFDSDNFSVTGKKYFSDDAVTWLLPGKLEPQRKRHLKTLRCWAKRFGNDRGHRLHMPVFNPFLKPEDQISVISQALEGKRYWNITLLGFMRTNAEYNDTLNSADVVMGMSGGEGFDMPIFHSIGLGKHCVGLAAHAYLDYLTEENTVLVYPSGKIEAHDGTFFRKGEPFNQGSFFDWSESDLDAAFDKVLERVQKNKTNEAGLILQERRFSKTLDQILEVCDSK